MNQPIFKKAYSSPPIKDISRQRFLTRSPSFQQFYLCPCCPEDEDIYHGQSQKGKQKLIKRSIKELRRDRSRSPVSIDSVSAYKSKNTETTSQKVSIKKLRKQQERVPISIKFQYQSPLPQNTPIYNKRQKNEPLQLIKVRSMENFNISKNEIIANKQTVEQVENFATEIKLFKRDDSLSIENQFNSLFGDSNCSKIDNQILNFKEDSGFKLFQNAKGNIIDNIHSMAHFSFGKVQKNMFQQKYKSLSNIALNQSKNQVSSSNSKKSKHYSFSSNDFQQSIKNQLQNISEQPSRTVNISTLNNLTQGTGDVVYHSQQESSNASMVLYTQRSKIGKSSPGRNIFQLNS